MGIYINPGNSGFESIVSDDYVDKSGIIGLLNSTIGTPRRLTCVSRPRRFGKSFAAQMLCAYYDCTCDSDGLFAGLKAAETPHYRDHLNAYNVVSLDISGFISRVRRSGRPLSEVPNEIVNTLQRELCQMHPSLASLPTLAECFIRCTQLTGRKFIFIIDEWDGVIREAKGDAEAEKNYLDLLREWFKNSNFTPLVVASAYMTGILPIKKDGSQSAISDFNEYTMLNPRMYAEYVGFTEKEVRGLCRNSRIDFEEMKRWYDGYSFKSVQSVYNPNSVMKAIRYGEFDSYWTESSAAEGLMDYLTRGYSGLTKTIAELIGGVKVTVNPIGFANDLTTFKGKDDILTLLVHLGYLAYDAEKKCVWIPNEEIRQEFIHTVRETDHSETLARLKESDQLLSDTIHENAANVASAIEKIHREEIHPLHYNREDSLRSVIKLAYYTYRDHYMQLEELPAGNGFADVVYLPKNDSAYPALVIELKWNQSADTAIHQILTKHYPEALRGYRGEILLVGISYDRNVPSEERKHTCEIQKYDMA